LQTRQDAGAADRLKTTNALLNTRDSAGEQAPRRLTGGKTVINLNRRM
jgi:hypothetical protein